MPSETGLVTEAYGHRFRSTCLLVPLVILAYDHLLTLESEINFVWRRPKKLSFFLFVILRYGSLSSNIALNILQFSHIPREVCHALALWSITLLIFQCLIVGSILALRVYIMYNRSKIVLLFLAAAGVAAVALGLWSMMGKSVLAPSNSGCEYLVSKQSALRMAGAWEAEFLCDLSVFVFTVLQAYRQPCKVPGSILRYMARDGALYFAILALVNLGNILMYYLGNSWMAASLSWLTSTLSVTLVSRLILHLHKVADVGILTERRIWPTVVAEQSTNTVSLHFTTSTALVDQDEEYSAAREDSGISRPSDAELEIGIAV
ncbi:hypothetical protein MVEN_01967000 [Mycena venus]|uniref:DUF6533 domain-containing protein n=1 Tax=Mycena venus TaxID=2733690 RepID=A0A8H7CLL2_9AGAR|nr:hypothetical protein MVEN_01967000 [Mycena venus]